MKKILFVCSGLYGGGTERVVARLSNYYVRNGYEVFIAATSIEQRYPLDEAIIIRQLIGGHLKIALSLREICRDIRPDIIIAMGTFFIYCAIFAKFRGCVVIGSERTDPFVSGKGFFKLHFRNLLYRYADHLVFQTPDAQAFFPDYISKKGTVIPNPLSSCLPSSFMGERSPIVVNFCRLTPAKNLQLLIDSFSIFRLSHLEYSLHIYGDGPQREELLDFIEKGGLSSFVTLHHNEKDVLDIVRSSAMFVSSSRYEGLSNSMLEAMAIGLPTICTDCPCGGARMMISNMVNGILVPNGDTMALAQAMSMVADDQVLAVKLSENAESIRDSLSIDRIAKMWEKLF